MDRKTSFVFYPSEFFSAVYNFKKSQIADLIIALCEINYYGKPLIKLSDIVKVRLDRMQESIDKNNAKYKEICEKRQISGAKGGSKRQAKGKQASSKKQAKINPSHPRDKENENESDYVYENGEEDKEDKNVDKSEFVGAPTVEEVAAYANESGYTIDPVAFVHWNEKRGWMNGKKYIAVDWRKAVRKWFCKENGLSFNELESMTDICHDVLSKVNGGADES